jgi:phage recombination protein Bet
MTTAIQTTKEEKIISFVPQGAADAIKLSCDIVKKLICIPTKSGAVCDDRQAMKFIMLCQAQRLNPFAGDAFLTGYDTNNKGPQFSLITAHQAFLKRAETSADYEGMESGIILVNENDVVTEREGDFKLANENVVGGWARVHRKNRKPTYRRLSIEAMKPNYDTPFWNAAKAPGQIVKCAEADALRATFPTLLGGLHAEGEGVVIPSSPIDIGVVGRSALVSEVSSAATPEQKHSQTDQSSGEPTPDKITPQAEVEAIVIKAGFDFTLFQKWLGESEQMQNASSVAEFSELPAEVCKRLLRATKGMLTQLTALKGIEA